MKEPTFLGIEEILDLHADQVQRYSGAPGLRDLTLLESALAVPAATFDGHFVHDSIFGMAAAYLVHLARNHPFLDGNKRTALMAAIAFLGLNGWSLRADPDELLGVVLAVAEGRCSKAEVAVFFQANARPTPGQSNPESA